MNTLESIRVRVNVLPPEKQAEVLRYVEKLAVMENAAKLVKPGSVLRAATRLDSKGRMDRPK